MVYESVGLGLGWRSHSGGVDGFVAGVEQGETLRGYLVGAPAWCCCDAGLKRKKNKQYGRQPLR